MLKSDMPTKTKTKTRTQSQANIKHTFGKLSEVSPVVKGNQLSPKLKTLKNLPDSMSAIDIVNYIAPEVAKYLGNVSLGVSPPHWARIDAAKFILLQHLNHLKAAGVLDESGRRIVSYKTLIILANQFISGKTTPDTQSQASEMPLESLREGIDGVDPDQALTEADDALEIDEVDRQ